MQKRLTDAYESVGKNLKIGVAPVGRVWAEVRRSDETLGRALYRGDGSHPSGKGAYLVAVVFAHALFGKQPSELTFTGGLKAAEVKVIRDAAAKILKKQDYEFQFA